MAAPGIKFKSSCRFCTLSFKHAKICSYLFQLSNHKLKFLNSDSFFFFFFPKNKHGCSICMVSGFPFCSLKQILLKNLRDPLVHLRYQQNIFQLCEILLHEQYYSLTSITCHILKFEVISLLCRRLQMWAVTLFDRILQFQLEKSELVIRFFFKSQN